MKAKSSRAHAHILSRASTFDALHAYPLCSMCAPALFVVLGRCTRCMKAWPLACRRVDRVIATRDPFHLLLVIPWFVCTVSLFGRALYNMALYV